jgi:hypothetical protein
MATSLSILLGAPDTNDCGECSACCDVIGVRAMGKPYYARCKHVGAGCGIYATRPVGCQTYRCAWHMGLLGDRVDRRPDRCGLLLHVEPEGTQCHLEIYELSPGAADTDKARYLKEMVLSHRRFRRLPLAPCYVRTFPFGADVTLDYPISAEYAANVEAGLVSVLRVNPKCPSEGRFEGRIRELLIPKDPSQPTEAG